MNTFARSPQNVQRLQAKIGIIGRPVLSSNINPTMISNKREPWCYNRPNNDHKIRVRYEHGGWWCFSKGAVEPPRTINQRQRRRNKRQSNKLFHS